MYLLPLAVASVIAAGYYGVKKVGKGILDALLVEPVREVSKRDPLGRKLEEATLRLRSVEKQAAMIKNALSSTKLLVKKLNDPEWMAQFDRGRENAKWN